MNIEILYKPAHTLAKVTLAPNEAIEAESGAMVGSSAGVEMTTSAGGFMKGLKRMFGGESLFRNTFTAPPTGGEILLAPALCGDMTVLDGSEGPWFLQSSTYVAAEKSIELETKLGGFKTFFSANGLFVLKARGTGRVVCGAFGGLERIDLDGEIVIDTGHLVAWQDRPELTYTVTKAGSGWIVSMLSGEGLVCHFKGRGTIWLQSRNPAEYGRTIGALLPAKGG